MRHRSTQLALRLLLPCCGVWAEPICLNKLTLAHAETIAYECNQQLLIAREHTEQASERKSQAVSKWLPAIHYRAEFRDISKPELFFNVFSTDFLFSHQGYSSILELNQPVFSTNLLFGLRQRRFEESAVQYEQANTWNELLLAVRKSYYAVIALEIAQEIERVNVSYLAYALEQEQGKLDAGNATPYEVNQSKVALANAISRYYLTLKDLKNARNALILTLGVDPLLESEMRLKESAIPVESVPEIALKMKAADTKYRYSSTAFPTTDDFLMHIERIDQAKKLILFSENELMGYIEMAIDCRPDLQSRKLQVDVAEQHLRMKQGTYFPEIKGYVRYSYNDISLGTDPFFSQPYHLSGGVVMTWNLFDSLLREHEIRQARSERKETRIGYTQELQQVEVAIRNGLYQLEEALFAYLSATQAVYLAEQAREQADEKLKCGKIAPLEYRDSVNLLAQAKNQKNRASFELISAYYTLRFATGQDASLFK
ncbi:MAG: hypothetical protein RL235_571 [Chlamydiota bacterium]|jgi:outer membrane protein TolC